MIKLESLPMATALGKRKRGAELSFYPPEGVVPATSRLIQQNNRKHLPCAERVHLIWADADINDFFIPRRPTINRLLRALSERAVVTLDRMVDGDLEEALERAGRIDRLGTLILLGHGSPDGCSMNVAPERGLNLLSLSDRAHQLMSKVDKIVLLSCYLGRIAAPFLAVITGKPIVATPLIINAIQLHAGEFVLRGEQGELVGRRYLSDRNIPIFPVAGFVPCSEDELIFAVRRNRALWNEGTLDLLNTIALQGDMSAASVVSQIAVALEVPIRDDRAMWRLAMLQIDGAFIYFTKFPPQNEESLRRLQVIVGRSRSVYARMLGLYLWLLSRRHYLT